MWQPRCADTMNRGPEQDQASCTGAIVRCVNSLTGGAGD